MSKIAYLIREGFRSIGTHGFMSFASVTVIMACLIIMGSVGLITINIDAMIGELENRNEVVAFVNDEYTSEQAQALEGAVKAVDNVSDAEFVSKEAAWEQFKSKLDQGLMEGVDSSVLRDRYVIHLEDIAQMAQTQSELEDIEGIDKVRAHLNYADRFVTIRNIVSIMSLVLMGLMIFVSVLIMTNTIKLATYGRREEIAIMKMVGATNAFIKTPFVIEGLILGMLGGGLGFLAMWGIYQVITERLIGTLAGSFITAVPFASVAPIALAAFMALGIIVGVFGGSNAIRNYLKV